MKKILVHHHNVIGHEINESLEYFSDDALDREIYCRKLHRITEPLQADCDGCPCFNGFMQGNGHECVWEDVEDNQHMDIHHNQRYSEYERVDRLLKQGVISDIWLDTVSKVKTLPYKKEEWIYEQSEDKLHLDRNAN